MLLDLVVSITVNLSEQKLYATRESGEQLVYMVSTGDPKTPTPVMSTEIERKYEVATLIGPGYSIPDVPWIMCPVENPEHCIHPNMSDDPLGEPHSLGCVRMNEEDAEELFSLVEEGTSFTVTNGV
jgi:L,D-transpeptidase ErfK/SrfK